MMSEQEEKQNDARVDAERDSRSTAMSMTEPAVENASATVIARKSPSGSDETVAEDPRPTYVPAALAMGIMMLLWGILTNWIMSAAGALVMVWAVTGWVREMHEP